MCDEKWGFGNPENKKPFDKIIMNGEEWGLIFGEHPHSRQDNNIYAKSKNNDIYGFSGHRRPFQIIIEEYNYLKTSHLSGDEIRKGGSVRVLLNNQQIYESFGRSYDRLYKKAERFIESLELLHWYPNEVNSEIGRVIGYREQLAVIDRFIISQGCMMIKTKDGKPFKRFLWEDQEDYEAEIEIKVDINDPSITWFPKI